MFLRLMQCAASQTMYGDYRYQITNQNMMFSKLDVKKYN